MSLQKNCIACDELPGQIPIQASVLSSKMFHEVTGLGVKSNDTICKGCQLELRNSYNFRKRCHEIFSLYNPTQSIDSSDPLTSHGIVMLKNEPRDMYEEYEDMDDEADVEDDKDDEDYRVPSRKRKNEDIYVGNRSKSLRESLAESELKEYLVKKLSNVDYSTDDQSNCEDFANLNQENDDQGNESNPVLSEMSKILARFKREIASDIKKEVGKLNPSKTIQPKLKTIKKFSTEELSKFVSTQNFTKVSSIDEFEALIKDIANDDRRSALAQVVRLLPDMTGCYNKIHGRVATVIDFLFEKTFIVETLKWGNMLGTSTDKICLINYPDIFDLATKVASTEENGVLVLPQAKDVKASFQIYFKHRVKKMIKELNIEPLEKIGE